ncbi:hypothetical protein D3C81_1919480 [compost metagenome]
MVKPTTLTNQTPSLTVVVKCNANSKMTWNPVKWNLALTRWVAHVKHVVAKNALVAMLT